VPEPPERITGIILDNFDPYVNVKKIDGF